MLQRGERGSWSGGLIGNRGGPSARGKSLSTWDFPGEGEVHLHLVTSPSLSNQKGFLSPQTL